MDAQFIQGVLINRSRITLNGKHIWQEKPNNDHVLSLGASRAGEGQFGRVEYATDSSSSLLCYAVYQQL